MVTRLQKRCNVKKDMKYRHFLFSNQKVSLLDEKPKIYLFTYFIHTYIYIYIYQKSASRFSRGTVLNTLKQSRINIVRGKKDASLFRESLHSSGV